MISLSRGANCPLPQAKIVLEVHSSIEADFCAFVLGNNGKTSRDADFLFYNNSRNSNNSVEMEQAGKSAKFTISLDTVPATVEKAVFALVKTGVPFSGSDQVSFELKADGEAIAAGTIETAGRSESAIIIGEVYRYKGAWKYRFIDQGFDGGLKPLAEHFGVEIMDDEASEAESARPDSIAPDSQRNASESRVNLSKVVLTKEKPKIDLKKKSDSFGKVRVNLNWNTGGGSRKGLFGFGGKSSVGVDLDLGAYIKMKNGDQTIIQALGNRFGDFNRAPYVKLLGDDRTGEVSAGEWIEINGDRIDQISEIVIFTFIYEGVANWKQTDGRVTIFLDGYPPVETFLTEGSNNLGLCAIARLKNEGGSLSIERINRYFTGHPDMDRAFGWGFSWVSGSK